MMQICELVERQGIIEMRAGNDRRKANPFGVNGPWLTTGKMGGLILTERRKIDRRAADKLQS